MNEKLFRQMTKAADPTSWLAAADLLEEQGGDGSPWRFRAAILQWFNELAECYYAKISNEERKAMKWHRRTLSGFVGEYFFTMRFGITTHTVVICRSDGVWPQKKDFVVRQHLLRHPDPEHRAKHLRSRALDIAASLEKSEETQKQLA